MQKDKGTGVKDKLLELINKEARRIFWRIEGSKRHYERKGLIVASECLEAFEETVLKLDDDLFIDRDVQARIPAVQLKDKFGEAEITWPEDQSKHFELISLSIRFDRETGSRRIIAIEGQKLEIAIKWNC